MPKPSGRTGLLVSSAAVNPTVISISARQVEVVVSWRWWVIPVVTGSMMELPRGAMMAGQPAALHPTVSDPFAQTTSAGSLPPILPGILSIAAGWPPSSVVYRAASFRQLVG